ncbi:MAG: PQQ-binding-like beta-propeller repeat protein [Gemmataceae bacterium]
MIDLFAVIPTLGMGGPLAILGVLFPSLFGGAWYLFRQWAAFFAVLSVNSLLAFGHWLIRPYIADTWFGSTNGLLVVMTFVTLIGVLWAWWRSLLFIRAFRACNPHLGRTSGEVPGSAPDEPQFEDPAGDFTPLSAGAETPELTSPQLPTLETPSEDPPVLVPELPQDAPPKTEHLVLWLLSGSALLMLVLYLIWPEPQLSGTWALVFALSAGVWAATLHKLGRLIARRSFGNAPGRLPVEAIILLPALATFVVFVYLKTPPRLELSAEITTADEQIPLACNFLSDEQYPLRMGGFGEYRMSLSKPAADEERIYAAAAQTIAGGNGNGMVCAIDRETGEVVWQFDDEGGMKPVYSSPWLANGKLYIGEGLHFSPRCKLYCLDAETGEKVWDFPTESQVESSPCVVDGVVYFGAGNEGVYALDAKSGKMLWNYATDPTRSTTIFRVGASPVVVDGRLYIGSGIERGGLAARSETAVVCLDARSGKEIWKRPTVLPCWSKATVAGPLVYFALGNGDLMNDPVAEPPKGHILCLDAKSGKTLLWEREVAGGIHTHPVIDAMHIYFGSRDGHCYCFNRFTGQDVWKRLLRSPSHGGPCPIVSSPVLDNGTLLVASTEGEIVCLDPATGKAHWRKTPLSEPFVCSSFRVMTKKVDDKIQRSLYFGAGTFRQSQAVACHLRDEVVKREVGNQTD